MAPPPLGPLVPLQLVFADGKPSVWYFSSGKDKAIKRKHRGNINNVNVNEAFVPKLLAAALANGDGGHGADYLGANATTGCLGTGAGTGWVSAMEPAAQKQHLNRTDPGPGIVAGPRAVEPGTSTGVTLGPWPNPGVVARFQGTMTMPHGAASSPKRKKGGVSRGRGRGRDCVWVGRFTNLPSSTRQPWRQHTASMIFRMAQSTVWRASSSPWHTRTRGLCCSFFGPHAAPARPRAPQAQGALLELQESRVEYITRDGLAELLPPGHLVVHGVAALHEGVLQRYVQPRGHHHAVVRATWSPNVRQGRVTR